MEMSIIDLMLWNYELADDYNDDSGMETGRYYAGEFDEFDLGGRN